MRELASSDSDDFEFVYCSNTTMQSAELRLEPLRPMVFKRPRMSSEAINMNESKADEDRNVQRQKGFERRLMKMMAQNLEATRSLRREVQAVDDL